MVKRLPRKFGIGFDLRQTMSLSTQKPRSWRIEADAEDVVVGADDPERAVLAQHPAAFRQPLPREAVVFREIREAVPVVVDAVDDALVRPPQLALQLQVVGRIGKHAVDRRRRQHPHVVNAVTQEKLV